MGAYVGSRFGQDTKSRIATSTSLLLEASEMPPEPVYQQVIPFLPPSVISGGSVGSGVAAVGASTSDEDWKSYPDRLDLHMYQGDDVVVPLYFVNAADPTLDMSTWEWKAQARMYHRYYALSTHDFVVTTELIPPIPPDTINQTLVSVILPRQRNRYTGVYSWDLHSVSPYDGPTLTDPPPGPDIHDENWPPTDQVKTWLYGYFYIVPRVTSTDSLPIPPYALPSNTAVIVTPTGVYGPNGRVP
jgi:hypothetical protein